MAKIDDLFGNLPPARKPDPEVLKSISSSNLDYARAHLPDLRQRPEEIPDDQISQINAPIWSFIKFEAEIESKFGKSAEFKNRNVIDGITLSGFTHVDVDFKSIRAQTDEIIKNLTDQDYLKEASLDMGNIKEMHLETLFLPAGGALKNNGPFQLLISPENGKLVFLISGTEETGETGRVEIPMAGLRQRGKSYIEFMELVPDTGDWMIRRKFESERRNRHNDHAAYLGEKFAQQGWLIGQAPAKYLFELSLYLLNPTLMAQADRPTNGPRHPSRGTYAPIF